MLINLIVIILFLSDYLYRNLYTEVPDGSMETILREGTSTLPSKIFPGKTTQPPIILYKTKFKVES